MGFWQRLLAPWRAKEQAAPTPAPQQRFSPDAPVAALLRSKAAAVAKEANDKAVKALFKIADHPKAIMQAMDAASAPTMAMDDGIMSGANWALGAFNSAVLEGTTFLGYPALAMLAQRAEYRKIAECVPDDMTSKFIRFIAKGEGDKTARIDELKTAFTALDVAGVFRAGATQDNYFGRGHIYLDTGDTDDQQELVTDLGDGWGEASKSKINKKHPLLALRTVEAVWCYPTSYNSNNPLKPDWYAPETWFVQSTRVHRSRLLTLVSRPVPDLLKPAYSFGGLSMTQMVKPYVDDWLEVRQNVNNLIQGFATTVLSTNLSTTTQADFSKLYERIEQFNIARSNFGTMVINKTEEDVKNVVTPIAGLDLLQQQSLEHVMLTARIPNIKFTGMQPSGLNASSEGELSVYEDLVHQTQEKLFRRPLKAVLGMVMLSLWNEIDADIDFEFEPLSSLDDKEKAEVAKTKAETDQLYIDMGALSQEEIRGRVAADDESPYAIIDINPDDVPDLLGEEEAGLEPAGGRPQLQAEEVEGDPTGATDASWNESDHPRAGNGEFGSGGGGSKPENKPRLSSKEKAYLSSYSGDEFLKLNKKLREGDTSEPAISHLDSAIKKSKVAVGTKLYRTVSRDALKKMLGGDTVEVGKEISDKGFGSATTSYGFARMIGTGQVILHFTAGENQSGLDMSGISSNEHEKEVMLPRNMKYKIAGITAPKAVGDPVLVRVEAHEDAA